MANALYDKGRQKFLEGSIAWLTDTIKLALVKTAYTVDLAAHEFVTDVTSGNIVARSGALASKTSTAGVANAANELISAVSGSQISYVVIYKDTGSDATSPLIGYIDTATGLPVTPTGADITVVWDTGSNKIFKL